MGYFFPGSCCRYRLSVNDMPWTYVSSAKIKASVIVILLSVTGLLFLGSGLIPNSYYLSSLVIQNSKSPNPYESIANATLGVGRTSREAELGDIANKTIQFQEVTAISLKSRPDRRQGILDAARATNISLKLLNAIVDKEIPTEYIPKVSACSGLLGAEYADEGRDGSWKNMMSAS